MPRHRHSLKNPLEHSSSHPKHLTDPHPLVRSPVRPTGKSVSVASIRPHSASLARSASSSTSAPPWQAAFSSPYPATCISTSSPAAKWSSIRPWKPPESLVRHSRIDIRHLPSASHIFSLSPFSNGHFRSSVLSVSPTSVSFSVSGLLPPPPSPLTSSSALYQASQGPLPFYPVKVNGSPWPHVSCSHASLDGRDLAHSQPLPIVITVYNLEPRHSYHIDLVTYDAVSDAPDHSRERGDIRTSSAHDNFPSDDSTDLDQPPPPYSSHDPHREVKSNQSSQREASLRAQIKKLRSSSKSAESTALSTISSTRRSIEKANKEDQKLRQRLITLQENARRTLELAESDMAETANVNQLSNSSEISEMELSEQLEQKKKSLRLVEDEIVQFTKESDDQFVKLQDQLAALNAKEEALLSEKHNREREVLPELNIRLANLEAQLRRLTEDAMSHHHPYAPHHPSHMNHPSKVTPKLGQNSHPNRVHPPSKNAAPHFVSPMGSTESLKTSPVQSNSPPNPHWSPTSNFTTPSQETLSSLDKLNASNENLQNNDTFQSAAIDSSPDKPNSLSPFRKRSSISSGKSGPWSWMLGGGNNEADLNSANPSLPSVKASSNNSESWANKVMGKRRS